MLRTQHRAVEVDREGCRAARALPRAVPLDRLPRLEAIVRQGDVTAARAPTLSFVVSMLTRSGHQREP